MDAVGPKHPYFSRSPFSRPTTRSLDWTGRNVLSVFVWTTGSYE